MFSTKYKSSGYFQIFLGASFFGLIPIFVRYGREINTASLAFFRAFFGAFFILIILKLQKRKLFPISQDFIKIIVWSLILLFAIASYIYSLKRIDIASATLLLNLNSAFIIVFSSILLKEKIYLFTILSLILSLSGAILIIGFSGRLEINGLIGYLAALSAAFWTGLNFVFPKCYLKSFDSHSMTFYQSAFQIPFLLPFVLTHPPVFSIVNNIIFCCLGLFCTAIAFTLIYSGSQKAKSQFIGIFQTSESIVPIIIACFLFKEYPNTQKIIGGSLLILSYVIVVWNDKKKLWNNFSNT